jgi:hypothetical protein
MEDKRAGFLITKYFTKQIDIVEGNIGEEVKLPRGLI